MRTKTVYEVEGKLFDTEREAIKYETLLAHLAIATACLNTTPGLDYNGGNYRQQTAEGVQSFIDRVAEALSLDGSHDLACMWHECPRGIVGRYLDDLNHPAANHYFRLKCIDEQLREWGQPYFALNGNPAALELKA